MQTAITEDDNPDGNRKRKSLFVSEREDKPFRPFDIRYSTEFYNKVVTVNNERCTSTIIDNNNGKWDGRDIGDDSKQLFFGAYGHLRKKLDYTYHCYYRKERQWLHDSIIEDFLEYQEEEEQILVEEDGCDAMTTSSSHCGTLAPWLILSVGVQGAGKHYTINQLVQKKRLRLLSLVSIAPGTCRRLSGTLMVRLLLFILLGC